MLAVVCPLCGQRKARRGCPALDKQICAVCCGTKRLVQIECPPDCAYLAVAREHRPPAAARSRAARAVHARPESAPVATLLSDHHFPRALSAAGAPAAA